MLDPAIHSAFNACLDAIRKGDAQAVAACFTEDAEINGSLMGPPRGAAGFAEAASKWLDQLPGLRLEPLRTYGEGPELAAKMRLTWKDRVAESIWAFRFELSGKATRLTTLWEPADILGGSPALLRPTLEAQVVAYYKTYNEDDEEAHVKLLSRDILYFGSVSRLTAEGVDTARGIFKSAHARMGLKHFDLERIYGTGPHLAAQVRMHGTNPGHAPEEGVWVFRVDEQDRFDRVSILWNPGSFLTMGPQ